METILEAPVAVTIFLITIITSVFAFNNADLFEKFLMRPYDVVFNKRYYQLFTSGLIHANFFHLLLNMLTFYFFAFYLERVFVQAEIGWNENPEWLGHFKFFLFYVIVLIAADVSTIIKYHKESHYGTLGASGAISGIVTAFILFNPTATIYALFIPMPSWLYGILYIGYSYFSSKRSNDNINHDAHLWGALAGIILTIIFYPQVLELLQSQFS